MCIRDSFYSASHNIIPDRIEAGTLLMAAAATGGDLLLQDVIPTHLEASIAKLKEMGYKISTTLDTVSYTHLDVYKRQGSPRYEETDLIVEDPFFFEEPRDGIYAIFPARIVLPLSGEEYRCV